MFDLEFLQSSEKAKAHSSRARCDFDSYSAMRGGFITHLMIDFKIFYQKT